DSNTGNLEENFGPWMIVEKKKNRHNKNISKDQKIGSSSSNLRATNRFESLAEQSPLDGGEMTNEGALNVKNSNSNSVINVVDGGNDRELGRQLLIKGMKGFSGTSINGALYAEQTRKMNQKSNRPTKNSSGTVINDKQIMVNNPINNGKGKMVSTSLQNSKVSDGAQQSNATASLSSLSKTIGSYLESGGPSCPKSLRGTSSHGKPPNRDCDRTDNAVDLRLQLMEDIAQMGRLMNQILPEVVHAQEQLNWGKFLDRVN
ncbi:hypothetical protein MKX03_008042, partial [Papaver bracteatum]